MPPGIKINECIDTRLATRSSYFYSPSAYPACLSANTWDSSCSPSYSGFIYYIDSILNSICRRFSQCSLPHASISRSMAVCRLSILQSAFKSIQNMCVCVCVYVLCSCSEYFGDPNDVQLFAVKCFLPHRDVTLLPNNNKNQSQKCV